MNQSPKSSNPKNGANEYGASEYGASVGAVSLVGGASVLNIFFGIIRMKVAAILLGPAGVGILGLFQQLIATASTLFALGFRESGTRQIADAQANRSIIEQGFVRRALFWSALGLAITGGTVFFALRNWFAAIILEDPLKGAEIGWLALGVALTVAAGSQQALLNGLRQVRTLALITVLTGALSAIIAITALVLCRDAAMVVFVLASPVASFVLGHYFVARLPRPEGPSVGLSRLGPEWASMVRLGLAVMLAALVVAVGHLAIRTILQHELGSEALGLFTAAWLISQYYIGFLYAALTMDYYPRLTAAISDREAASQIINEQTEIGLLFAAPLFLMMMALAPYVLLVLYSQEFIQAADTLRWFVLGDILKTAAHPIGFALLAASAGRIYLGLRIFSIAVFVIIAVLLIPVFGISGAGISYMLMYLIYLPIVFLLVKSLTGFSVQPKVVSVFGLTFFSAIAIASLSFWSSLVSAILGSVFAILVGLFSLSVISHRGNLSGPVGRLAFIGKEIAILGKRYARH